MCDYLEFLQYPVDESLKLWSKKWGAPVLMELYNGNDRFNTLRDSISHINPRTLSARLDDLEHSGPVKREVTQSRPSKVRYRLTDKGEDMRLLVRGLSSFSLKWYSSQTPTRA